LFVALAVVVELGGIANSDEALKATPPTTHSSTCRQRSANNKNKIIIKNKKTGV
jgi:hypothetical protein